MFELKFDNWIEARWLINCAMAAIDESYEKNSIRYAEMKKLNETLHQQMREQVGEDYDT